jgi:hypothetical protein
LDSQQTIASLLISIFVFWVATLHIIVKLLSSSLPGFTNIFGMFRGNFFIIKKFLPTFQEELNNDNISVDPVEFYRRFGGYYCPYLTVKVTIVFPGDILPSLQERSLQIT